MFNNTNKGYLFYNGQFFAENEFFISVKNRGFLYGDGLFETMRIISGRVCFFNDHMSRIFSGAQTLQFDVNKVFKEELFQQITSLIHKNAIAKGGKLRLTFTRKDGGLYTPQNDEVNVLVTVEPLHENLYNYNQDGLLLGTYFDVLKPINIFSSIKSNNALLYVKAGIYAKNNLYDEVLLFNQNNLVCEAVSSNVFYVKNDVIYTTQLTEGCLPGVMRKQVISLAKYYSLKVEETKPTLEMLLDADEVFLTNTIKGIKWVKSLKGVRYFNKTSRFLSEMLNKQLLFHLAEH